MNPSVLLVDDSRPFLEIARLLLENDGLEVVGTATTSAHALAQARALHPQVALVDVNLGGESGLQLARRFAGLDTADHVSVILMSTHDESEYADLLVGSPVLGFLAKERLSGASVRELLGC